MAVVVGVIDSVSDVGESNGPGSASVKVMHCRVGVTWPTGTYAQADNANFTAATAIQNCRRNGKTVTVLRACFAAPGEENGTVIGAGDCTVSSGVVTCPLTTADLSTERADGAMNANFNKPVFFDVTFTEAK